MTDEHKDKLLEIKALADVLSAVDQDASINADTVQRIGDLISNLIQNML